MILELFLWSRSNRQRARIEELERRLGVKAEPPPREGPGNGGKLVLLILAVIGLLALVATNSGPAETLIYVDGIPVPTPRPLP